VTGLRAAHPSRATDRGSASVWVLACCALLLVIAYAEVLRGAAVLARHRAESTADLAALAAAGRIGVGAAPCTAAERIAAANSATLADCYAILAADGRTGTVFVRVQLNARLAVVGSVQVTATARAGRLPP
jgi:secretion/DNA translocation related TadE-like protein